MSISEAEAISGMQILSSADDERSNEAFRHFQPADTNQPTTMENARSLFLADQTNNAP
jgi:hypothetical protein